LEEDGKRQWGTEAMNLYLGQKGSDVLLIIASDEATSEKVLAEFPGY
jgi:lipoprotein NlpI